MTPRAKSNLLWWSFAWLWFPALIGAVIFEMFTEWYWRRVNRWEGL